MGIVNSRSLPKRRGAFITWSIINKRGSATRLPVAISVVAG
jgi:hypothetical protein